MTAALALAFDFDQWWGRLVADVPQLFTADKEGTAYRQAFTADDPLMFAALYLRRHITDKVTGTISMSEFHLQLRDHARSWMEPVVNPGENRDAYIAPRESGKSTWLFLILPLWAAAHGHSKFIAAFADSAPQAEGHLSTFKNELDTNSLLRLDYPDLTQPQRRKRGMTIADNQGMIHQKNGFTFAARGIASGTLGLKVDERRPDLLLLDDIEPSEENYSAYLASKRLTTLTDTILPLNIYARVLIAGTTVMVGSLIHQLVEHKAALEQGQATGPHDWVNDEQVRVHHFRAIMSNDDGTRRSLWPAKWSLSFLESIEHTRSYAKNYDNNPMAMGGKYWSKQDITYGVLDAPTRTHLWLDPAITQKQTSDETGIAVVSWQPPSKEDERHAGLRGRKHPGLAAVRHIEGVRLASPDIRERVLELCELWPEIRVIFVEGNLKFEQPWPSILVGVPAHVVVRQTTEPKEVRFARALDHYQQGRVIHERVFPEAEKQMIGFPNYAHDDQADAAVGGILEFLDPRPTKRAGGRTIDYVTA